MADRWAERIVDYGVPAIILTLPLEFTAQYLHQQLVRFVIAVVLLAFVYLVVRRRRALVVPRFASALLLVALCAVSVASWLATRAPGSTNNLLDVAAYPFVGLLVANLALTREEHRRAWIAFLVSAVGVAVVGAVLYLADTQLYGPALAVTHRENATFYDPNITARFLTLGACAAVLLFAARKTPTWLTASTAVACAVMLPVTWSRSGLALFVLMVVLMIPLAFDRRRAAAIAAVALVAFGLSTMVNPDTRQRAGYAADTVVSFVTGTHFAGASGASAGEDDIGLKDNRVYLISAGLKMFTDHPLTGVGFGAYQHQILTTYRRYLPEGYTDSVSHTSVITVLAEQGFVGALLLVLFLVQLAREAWAARRRTDRWTLWATVAGAMVVPILLYSQFEARLLQEPYLWLALGLFYGAQQAALRSAVAVRPEGTVRVRRSVEAA